MPKYKKRPDGRYLYQLSLGRDEAGKRQFKNIYAKSVKELENKIAQTREALNHNRLVTDSVPVAVLCEMLLKSKAGKARNTLEMYRRMIDGYILPAIGDKTIDIVKPFDIQAIINDMHAKGLTRSIDMLYLTVKQLCDLAFANNWSYALPYKHVELPKIIKPQKQPLTDIEAAAMLCAPLDPAQMRFVSIALMCGLRRGEVLALTGKDIDMGQRVLYVKNNNTNGIINPYAKSDAGTRQVPIPDRLFDILQTHGVFSPDEILVPQQKDCRKYQTNSSFKKLWQGIESVTGINTTPHILRHTYATKLYYSGIDVKTAQYLLGHATLQITLDIYTHLDAAETARQSAKLRGLFA